MDTARRRLSGLINHFNVRRNIVTNNTGELTSEQAIELYIRVCRIYEAVSCTYTGEARYEVFETLQWIAKVNAKRDEKVRLLILAIEKAGSSGEAWERRCMRISEPLTTLAARLQEMHKQPGFPHQDP